MTKDFRMIEGEKFYIYNYGDFSLTKEQAERKKISLKKRWNRAVIIFDKRYEKFGAKLVVGTFSFGYKFNLNKFKFKIRLEKNSKGEYAVLTNIEKDYLINLTNKLSDDNWETYLM